MIVTLGMLATNKENHMNLDDMTQNAKDKGMDKAKQEYEERMNKDKDSETEQDMSTEQ
jgi:hypothetical protein